MTDRSHRLAALAAEAGLHLQEAAVKLLTQDDVERMTAGQINKALDRLEKESSKITDELIAAGRGNQRPSEMRNLTDPLSLRYWSVASQQQLLRDEVTARYGPGAPHRLPTGRGFGPRVTTRK